MRSILFAVLAMPAIALAGYDVGEDKSQPAHCDDHEHCGAVTTVVNPVEIRETTIENTVIAPAYEGNWFINAGANLAKYGEDGGLSDDDYGWQLGVGYKFTETLDVHLTYEDFGSIGDNREIEAQAATVGLGYTAHLGKNDRWFVGGSLGYSLMFTKAPETRATDLSCGATSSAQSRSRAASQATAESTAQSSLRVEYVRPDYLVSPATYDRPRPIPTLVVDTVVDTEVDVETQVQTDTVVSTTVNCNQNYATSEEDRMYGVARAGIHGGVMLTDELSLGLEVAHRELTELNNGLTSYALNLGYSF